jgi:hypothetical protein
MSIKTQGSELFFADTLSSSVAQVMKMACPTGITGLGGPADQIEDTCLDDLDDKSFAGGLGNPGQVTVPFVMKPWEGSQQTLWDLKASKETIEWMIGLSDGIGNNPTLDSNDALVAPEDRTSFGFRGYVADLNIDIATNEVVRGTLLIQRSGSVTPYWNGPTP